LSPIITIVNGLFFLSHLTLLQRYSLVGFLFLIVNGFNSDAIFFLGDGVALDEKLSPSFYHVYTHNNTHIQCYVHTLLHRVSLVYFRICRGKKNNNFPGRTRGWCYSSSTNVGISLKEALMPFQRCFALWIIKIYEFPRTPVFYPNTLPCPSLPIPLGRNSRDHNIICSHGQPLPLPSPAVRVRTPHVLFVCYAAGQQHFAIYITKINPLYSLKQNKLQIQIFQKVYRTY
jgi:hypothetical protein